MFFGKKKSFFTDEDRHRIAVAIGEAELMTSGEIRVFMESSSGDDAVKSAQRAFQKLKMHKTTERNGVLIYLAYEDREFAIIGDDGIHQKVGDDFWNSVRDEMQAQFKEKKFVEGLIAGISAAGKKLAEHFPHQANDRNELSNEMVEGK